MTAQKQSCFSTNNLNEKFSVWGLICPQRDGCPFAELHSDHELMYADNSMQPAGNIVGPVY